MKNSAKPAEASTSRNARDPLGLKPLVLFFFFFVILLGGGTLLQVLHQKKEIRDTKSPVPTHPAASRPAKPRAEAEDPLSLYQRERQNRIRAEFEGIDKEAPSSRSAPARFQNQDLAAIARDQYGTLNREFLAKLKDLNPHIRDWNALPPSVDLVLPPQATIFSKAHGPVNIWSVRLTSLGSSGLARQAAERLEKAGAQNVLVVPAGDTPAGKPRFHLCMGVFESESETADTVTGMRNTGFPHARPIRIREPNLARLIHPFRDAALP
jgi:hypothetical protein